MRTVYVMRGVSGSGKSTEVKGIISRASRINKSIAVCSADDFFTNPDGEYNFDFTKISEAHRVCFRKFLDALNSGTEVVVCDNTNVERWEYTPYVQAAEAMGYNVCIREMVCTLEEAIGRNVHEVPAYAVEAMWHRWERVLPHHQEYVKELEG